MSGLSNAGPSKFEDRILLLAPTGRDGEVIGNVLNKFGFDTLVCKNLGELCLETDRGAGALLIADEALSGSGIDRLATCLKGHAPWSAIPVLVMTQDEEATGPTQRRLDSLAPLGNLTLLERPLRIASFTSNVRSALRARKHQYEIRSHLERQASERKVLEMVAAAQSLADTLETICRMTEVQISGCTCCVLAWDSPRRTLGSACSPGMPDFGRALQSSPLDGVPLPADLANEARIIENLGKQKSPDAIGQLASKFGFQSAWLRPLRSGAGDFLGWLNLYYKESPRQPIGEELGRRDAIANLATLAMERQNTEAHVRESEERYRTLAESMPQLVWTCLPNGSCDYLSNQWATYTGLPTDQQLGFQWLDTVMHPDDRDRTYQAWMSAVRGEAPYDLDYRLRRQDGAYRWFRTRGVATRDANGVIKKWFGSCTDVQEMRDARDALRESEERFRTMANSAPVLIWSSGLDKKRDFVNEPWLQFTGRTMAQELGDGWAEGVHPDDLQVCMGAYISSFDARQPFNMEYRLKRHDGDWRWLLDCGVPRLSPDGDFRGYIGSCIDITDRRAMEEALRASNQELEEFAFVASHDLQEPLRTLKLYTQLLVSRFADKSNREVQTFSSFIVSNVERMEDLIHDVLSFSRVIHGEAPELKEVDLNAIFDGVAALANDRKQDAKGIITRGSLPMVYGEASQLEQVLQNIVSNALKYHKAGQPPRIEAAAQRQDGYWQISIQDNGIGFDQKYADRIFGLFRRLHRDEYPGTGIGLAICKRIVEKMGGRIWAEAELDRGATFHFTIPIRPPIQPAIRH